LAKLLLKNVDLNIQSLDKRTALHLSALNGATCYEITKLLTMKGAALDIMDCEGNTPLHYAAQTGHPETLTLML
jgi:ankyrin repeat protein